MIKAFIDDVGGVKNLTLGAMLLMLVSVAAYQYMESQAQATTRFNLFIHESELRHQRYEILLEAPRFTRLDGERLTSLRS